MPRTCESSKTARALVAFLPIKPVYARRILAGDKRFEFRRAPMREDFSHIIIYASTPIKMVVGVAEVATVATSSPSAAWESSKHRAGITRKDFRKYFATKKLAYTIKLGNVTPFDRHVPLNEVAIGFKVPQSFAYVSPAFMKVLLRAANRP